MLCECVQVLTYDSLNVLVCDKILVHVPGNIFFEINVSKSLPGCITRILGKDMYLTLTVML